MSLADSLTLARIPLGALFLAVAGWPALALGVLALAGASDVLDGWAARKQRPSLDHTPHRGDWLDPLCDKLFMAAVVTGIYLAYRPPLAFLLAMVTRELVQLTSLAVYRALPALRERMTYVYRAHPVGKITTVTQFVAASAFVLEHEAAPSLALLSAAFGIASVAIYLHRARLIARSARPT